MTEILFPQKSEILELQADLIDKFGGIHGIRDEGAFESALTAAENRFHYETEELAKLAATLPFIFRRHTLFSTAINELRRRLQESFSV